MFCCQCDSCKKIFMHKLNHFIFKRGYAGNDSIIRYITGSSFPSDIDMVLEYDLCNECGAKVLEPLIATVYVEPKMGGAI